MILQGILSALSSLSLSLSLTLSLSPSFPIIKLGHVVYIQQIQLANVKIDNIHKLAIPADRRPVGAGKAYTSPVTRTRRLMKQLTAQHGGARTKRFGRYYLSLLFIYARELAWNINTNSAWQSGDGYVWPSV